LMTLYYLANIRFPTEKAHGIQIMKMCEMFALLKIKNQSVSWRTKIKNTINNSKIEIELIVPRRFNKIKDNPFAYYGVQPVFKITKLPCLDLIKLGKIGFFIQTITFLISARIYLLFRNYDILYTREALTGLFFRNFVLEVHYFPEKITLFHKAIWQRAKRFIVLTIFIKNNFIGAGISSDKILVAADGVDLEKFDIVLSKEDARRKLNLPYNKKIVVYTGHLYVWKGVNVLLETARNLQNILFIFIGGTKQDVKKFQQKAGDLDNVMIAGHRPHQEISYWLKAADVLVLPNSAKEKISQFYTSPMKLFEYMASGQPIVASDLPSIREILNESNAVLVESDNSSRLVEGIIKILKNPDFSAKISKQAYLDVQNYTWQKRAKKILEFI